ncbi:hypothetical protein [Variovorax sp. PMC12]|uniref:hypothetical protein n=1 Tax=Variovorax sp. PMC12 TaxID=2126319 RepID=UPI000D131FF1|nr:hypothetical protein [Variovorax sp. PMC12]AVQ80736.1 hypothetical protein C4F17_07110 [Variovorax sp. PMC12]
MSVIVDREVEYHGAEFVSQGNTLSAVQAAYNKAILNVARDDRTPVQLEVVIRVSPKETQ